MDLRFGLNEPCETAHIYLTALARFAQWAGYYACTLVALLRGGALTILTGMLTGRHDLACFHEVCVSYTQFSKPEPCLFSPPLPAHRIARTRPHTLVCFERITTEVENLFWIPYQS
jgi:hypothetical protein